VGKSWKAPKGATAANAIIGRIKEEEPEELPQDCIRQWEVRALYEIEAVKDCMALGFKRRLEAGATVQPGPYFLKEDVDTMEDLEKVALDGGASGTCTGFAEVGYREVQADIPARTGRVLKRGRK
jgi:hypothetical protein